MFNSYGFTGFKTFVIDNDVNILNKILFGIQKFQKKDQKITIVTLKFSMEEYEKIKNGHRLRTYDSRFIASYLRIWEIA